MVCKIAVLALLLAVCAYQATAKPANTLALPTEPNRDPDRPVPLPGSAPCIEGKSWKHDCNNCVCNNGVAACTQKLCLSHKVNKRQTCQEGTRWKGECDNNCVCSNGVPLCTLKGCVPKSTSNSQGFI